MQQFYKGIVLSDKSTSAEIPVVIFQNPFSATKPPNVKIHRHAQLTSFYRVLFVSHSYGYHFSITCVPVRIVRNDIVYPLSQNQKPMAVFFHSKCNYAVPASFLQKAVVVPAQSCSLTLNK